MGHYTLVGFFGGIIVFFIESIDRLVTLWTSFNDMYEPVAFASYLVPIVLIGVLVGTGLGLGLVVTEDTFRSIRRRVEQLSKRWSAWLAGVITAVVLVLLLRGLLVLAPDSVKHALADFAWRIHDNIVPTLDPYGNSTRLLVFACLVIVASMLLSAAWLLEALRTRRSRRLDLLLFALCGVALLVFYAVDSRFEFGRHEASIHVPADVLLFITAVSMTELACVLFRSGFWKLSSMKWITGLLITFTLIACVFDVAHFGASHNLKALLLHRSIVARRAYQIVGALAPGHDKGFASLSYGGKNKAGALSKFGTDKELFFGNQVAFEGRPIPLLNVQSGLTKAATPRMNLILISIDTLRADRMSCYGYNRLTTPRLSGLAAAGRIFDRAYSQATSTGPAFASMQRSAMRGNVFDASRSTLFGLLAEAGYRTALISAGPDDTWLRKNKAWKQYCEIMFKGIQETPHSSGDYWDAHQVTNEALAHIASIPSGTTHATWIHYLDPHTPRRKLAAFDFGDSLSDKYDSEVAFVDQEVGRLIDALRDSGATENSIVVFTADHGESFGEHGVTDHGNRPYDDQIHIPLMIWAPGITPGRITQPVALIDIAPTVLAFIGIPGIEDAEGRDLLVDDLDSSPIFSEVDANYSDPSLFSYSSFFPYAVTFGGWRPIYDMKGNTLELYDMTRDPEELHNVADREPERLNQMREILAHWLRNTTPVP